MTEPAAPTPRTPDELGFRRIETVDHARDWLALSTLGEEARGAVRDLVEKKT